MYILNCKKILLYRTLLHALDISIQSDPFTRQFSPFFTEVLSPHVFVCVLRPSWLPTVVSKGSRVDDSYELRPKYIGWTLPNLWASPKRSWWLNQSILVSYQWWLHWMVCWLAAGKSWQSVPGVGDPDNGCIRVGVLLHTVLKKCCRCCKQKSKQEKEIVS